MVFLILLYHAPLQRAFSPSFSKILELLFTSSRVLIRSWLFSTQNFPCSVSICACLELVWRFGRRTFYIGGHTHRKLIKHGKFCMLNDQLLTKSPVLLKENSIDVQQLQSMMYTHMFMTIG